MNVRRLLIAYVVVNAVLYSVLLPLWEGFDEPFHFGYVQQLANGQGFPDPRTARLSSEVEASILLAPASYVVQQNLPQVTTYAGYFSWPAPKRAGIQRRLEEIPKELRWEPSHFVNYEAQHPPLAYMPLAIPERLLAAVPLPIRVALLRIFVALAGSLLLLIGAEKLFAQLGIHNSYRAVALFCLFSCQMTWAAIAHVGNDWLAIPLSAWLLVALNECLSGPRPLPPGPWPPPGPVPSAVLLALGLLTKAYFLAFLPLLLYLVVRRFRWKGLAIAAAILLGLAGPWYGRNLLRYGVLSATQESRAGAGLHAVLRAAPKINWRAAIWSDLHYSLWTGNNTFLTFSAHTLDVIIGAGLVGLLIWALSRHSHAERTTLLFIALFVLALGYAASATYASSQGAHSGAEPWYSQVLSAPLLALILLGASRRRRLGKFVAGVLTVLFGYVMMATYVVKLIPLYGGYEGRTSLVALATLYTRGLKTLIANLDTVAIAPAALVCLLAAICIALTVAQQVVVIRNLFVRTEK